MAKNSSMTEKRYIRLIGERELWNGMVAEVVDSNWLASPDATPMIVFYDGGGRRRCVGQHQAEFITKKEYFKGLLAGRTTID